MDFSLVSDVIFKMGWGGAVWNDVAFYTIAGGTVGALLAALPGFVDLTDISNPKTKSIALWHMSINLLAVVLTQSTSGCEYIVRLATIFQLSSRSSEFC